MHKKVLFERQLFDPNSFGGGGWPGKGKIYSAHSPLPHTEFPCQKREEGENNKKRGNSKHFDAVGTGIPAWLAGAKSRDSNSSSLAPEETNRASN